MWPYLHIWQSWENFWAQAVTCIHWHTLGKAFRKCPEGNPENNEGLSNTKPDNAESEECIYEETFRFAESPLRLLNFLYYTYVLLLHDFYVASP